MESLETEKLTKCLKMGIALSSEATDQFQSGQKDMEDPVDPSTSPVYLGGSSFVYPGGFCLLHIISSLPKAITGVIHSPAKTNK